MLYLTDFSTASKRLNFNNVAKSSAEPNSFELCRDAATSRRNPIQETDRFRSVGSGITLLLSVPNGRDIETVWQKSVICYIRAKNISHRGSPHGSMSDILESQKKASPGEVGRPPGPPGDDSAFGRKNPPGWLHAAIFVVVRDICMASESCSLLVVYIQYMQFLF